MQSVCEQQRSCSPGFRRKELHATEGAVEVRRARRRLGEAATDERVGLFTPDKKRGTADGAGRAANLAARRGTVWAKWVASSDFRQPSGRSILQPTSPPGLDLVPRPSGAPRGSAFERRRLLFSIESRITTVWSRKKGRLERSSTRAPGTETRSDGRTCHRHLRAPPPSHD